MNRLDRIAWIAMAGLAITIGTVLGGGKLCGEKACPVNLGPKLREFSWQDRAIGVNDTALILTFDRPMDPQTLIQGAKFNPPLAGRWSWSGRRFAYTLSAPPVYGTTYELTLQGVQEHFPGNPQRGQTLKPWRGTFRSRDRLLAYIGTDGEEQGRLVLYRWKEQQRIFLTPPHLWVLDFQAYPDRQGLLFSAIDRQQPNSDRETTGDLYRVTWNLQGEPQPPQVLVSQGEYQNLRFALGSDGETLVVQRSRRDRPADFSLWWRRGDGALKDLGYPLGGELALTPDNGAIAAANGEGVAILPLDPPGKPLDFLPEFGQVVGFAANGSAAAMVNFNRNRPDRLYTRTLTLVNNQGRTQELLGVDGSVLGCQFTYNAKRLYCLVTRRLSGRTYQEQPIFVAIDPTLSKTDPPKITPLAELPEYQDVRPNLAPDDLGLVFERITKVDPQGQGLQLRNNSGEAIITSEIWLLIPQGTEGRPTLSKLPLAGIRPQWLP